MDRRAARARPSRCDTKPRRSTKIPPSVRLRSVALALLSTPCGCALLANAPADRSRALPFLARPVALDGCAYVGDAGFDPLGFATAENLGCMREAEVRHGRLAMVATWGWPVAEVGYGVAKRVMPVASVCSGNGCAVDRTALAALALSLPQIGIISLSFWVGCFFLAAAGEAAALRRDDGEPVADAAGLWRDADAGERRRLELCELKHGRLAMVALLVRGALMLRDGVALAKPNLTFAHQVCAARASPRTWTVTRAAGVADDARGRGWQLWGETCVYNVLTGFTGMCIEQSTSQGLGLTLSWESARHSNQQRRDLPHPPLA
jgi:hypothetical protein